MTAPGPAGPPMSYPVPPGAGAGPTAPAGPTGPGGAAPGGAAPGVPAPPAGPGVQPPFPAPPTEGRTVRLWIGLGAAALAVLLCCGGGSAALVGLIVTGTEAINEQAQVVVRDYLDAVSEREYDRAYSLLCDEARSVESQEAFERRVAAEPEIASYEVGDVVLGATDLVVPVEVSYFGGGRENLSAELAQDPQTAELRVCRIG